MVNAKVNKEKNWKKQKFGKVKRNKLWKNFKKNKIK